MIEVALIESGIILTVLMVICRCRFTEKPIKMGVNKGLSCPRPENEMQTQPPVLSAKECRQHDIIIHQATGGGKWSRRLYGRPDISSPRITVTSHSRGWLVVWRNNRWLYADDFSIMDDSRPCKKCNRFPTAEGYDACLGHLPGVKHACCGHGVEEGYEIR